MPQQRQPPVHGGLSDPFGDTEVVDAPLEDDVRTLDGTMPDETTDEPQSVRSFEWSHEVRSSSMKTSCAC